MGVWDWIFPRGCVGCGRWGSYVCERCEVGMWEAEQMCPACGGYSRYGLRHKRCVNRGSLAGVSCIWANEGWVKKLVRRAEERGWYDGVRWLGERAEGWSSREELGKLREWLRNTDEVELVRDTENDEGGKVWWGLVKRELGVSEKKQGPVKRAVLVGVRWRREVMQNRARRLVEGGVKEVWGMVLVK